MWARMERSCESVKLIPRLSLSRLSDAKQPSPLVALTPSNCEELTVSRPFMLMVKLKAASISELSKQD